MCCKSDKIGVGRYLSPTFKSILILPPKPISTSTRFDNLNLKPFLYLIIEIQ